MSTIWLNQYNLSYGEYVAKAPLVHIRGICFTSKISKQHDNEMMHTD